MWWLAFTPTLRPSSLWCNPHGLPDGASWRGGHTTSLIVVSGQLSAHVSVNRPQANHLSSPVSLRSGREGYHTDRRILWVCHSFRDIIVRCLACTETIKVKQGWLQLWIGAIVFEMAILNIVVWRCDYRAQSQIHFPILPLCTLHISVKIG